MLSELQKLRKEKIKAKEKREWRETAAICNCIGQELVRLGKYEEARLSHCEELEYCALLQDELGKAVANRKIGECYAELGDFKKALHHQTIFLEIAIREKSLVEEQRAWATLGRTYIIKYQQEVAENLSKEVTDHSLNQAERAFHKALKLAESIKSVISPKEYEEMRSRLLLNLGLVYEQRNDLIKCSDSIRYAIFLAKKNNLYEDLHRCQYSLASVYQRCKQNELALRILDEAISSAKVLRDKSYIFEAMSAKANVLLQLKDFEAAKTYLKKAYKIRSPIVSDQEKIEQQLKVVITLCECEQKLSKLFNPSDRKSVLEKIADCLATLGCYKLSVDYYLKTLECLKTLNAPLAEKAAIYYSIAQTYADDSNYSEAILYLKKEFECNKEKPLEQVKTLWKMADLLEMQKNYPNAENMLLKALTLAETVEDKKSVYLGLKRLHAFYQSVGNSSKLLPIARRITNFKDYDSEEEEEELTETEQLFEEIDLNELLSDSSDSENEAAVVKRFKRSNKLDAKRNELGETVLHRACIAGKYNLVKQLVENGHSINVRDNCGWSPLHEACNHGYHEIVEYLISKGANINDRGGAGCRGVTPLIDAASCGNLDVIELLLSKGASVTIKNDNGETALDELIKWRQRCEGDLDQVTLHQSVQLEDHLKSLLRKAGHDVTHTNLVDTGLETTAHDFSEESLKSSSCISSRSNDKRPYSSSSSDDEIYTNPHLDWDKENDFNDPQKVKSDYQAVMSSIRHNTKHTDVPAESDVQKAPLAALLEESNDRGWLIQDTNTRGKAQKKKKRHKSSNVSLRRTNYPMEKYLSANGSDSDSLQSSPIECDDRSSYKTSADESSISESSLMDSKSRLAIPARVSSVRVRVTDKIIFVPVLDESLNIGWLANEASNRFQNLMGKKPILHLMKKDGAYLSPDDLIRVVLQNNEELKTSVSSWELTPLLEVYKQNCVKNKIQVCGPVENRLRPFEITTELNFSDICLPTSQLVVLLKSLDSHHQLTHLNLSNNSIEAILPYFISCIPLFQVLTSLNMSNCGFTSAGIKDITKFLRQSSVPCIPKLQQLGLSFNQFGPETASDISVMLEMFGDLQVLKLSACDIDEEFFSEALCGALSDNMNIMEFDLSGNELNSSGISSLLMFLPQNRLTRLDLSHTVSNKDDIINIVCKYLSRSMPHLEELLLKGCNLRDKAIIMLSEHIKFCPKLSLINLSSNPGLSGEVFLKLVETSHAFNIPFSTLLAIGCFEWNEKTANNFCKAFQTRLLRNVVFNYIPEPLHEQMYGVWMDVWSGGISCNDIICEFSIGRFMTLTA